MGNGIFAGEEGSVVFDDGTEISFILDLSQGAEDDLVAFDKERGGNGFNMYLTKMLELAITNVVPGDGTPPFKPSFEQVRGMKTEVTKRLRNEVMSLWFPLPHRQLMALEALELEQDQEIPGRPSTGNGDLVAAHQNGTSE